MAPTIADLRQDVAFSTAPKRLGAKPWAAPLRALNNAASRNEDWWVNPERDGPRRLNEGSVPYWKTLPRPIGRPVFEAIVEQRGSGIMWSSLASFLQDGIDCLEGVCALVLAAKYMVRGKAGLAGIALGAHSLHIVKVVALTIPIILIVCL